MAIAGMLPGSIRPKALNLLGMLPKGGVLARRAEVVDEEGDKEEDAQPGGAARRALNE